MLIYHIVTPKVWERFNDADEYEAESLQTEGFIHCSYLGQLERVLERYYKNAGKILILTINPQFLSSELVAEPSTNNEIYPHIYGRINKSAIAAITERNL